MRSCAAMDMGWSGAIPMMSPGWDFCDLPEEAVGCGGVAGMDIPGISSMPDWLGTGVCVDWAAAAVAAARASASRKRFGTMETSSWVRDIAKTSTETSSCTGQERGIRCEAGWYAAAADREDPAGDTLQLLNAVPAEERWTVSRRGYPGPARGAGRPPRARYRDAACSRSGLSASCAASMIRAPCRGRSRSRRRRASPACRMAAKPR